MTELKPCPFCGGEAKIGEHSDFASGRNRGGRWLFIYCKKCGNGTRNYFWDDKKYMIEAWNRRVNDGSH